VLPVADAADSCLLSSAGQLNELADVSQEMVMAIAIASLRVVEGVLARRYGSYHLLVVVAMIVEV
jgi:hypothetical protein